MSLLEDIFLQDEADEAQELERVIEGDEYEERPRSRSATPNSDENEPKDDEAEEDKRRVDPTSTKAKRVIKNPRFLLNPARLTGPRGIQIIPDHFKDFKFKGKGHEKEDLDMVLKKLEHWAYRLYPKFQFEDCLKKIESLGKKRPVMVHLHKIRTDQFISEETVVQKDSSDEETQPPQEEDEFDKLLQQQIELARATPAPSSVKKVMDTPKKDRSPFTMPKATSSPSISDDQKERMIRNRKLAEERRLARLKQNSMNTSEKQDSANNISEIIEVDEEAEESVPAKKHNRSHVIDSSDDECDVTSVNQSVAVDVHNGTNREEIIDNNKDHEKVVLEDGGNNLDDIEMEQNGDQDIVEVINNVDKDTGTNDRVTDNTGKAFDEVIEINDPTDIVVSKVIEINQNNKGIDDIIEINDQNDKVIEIKDKNKTSFDEVIEINDHVDEVSEDLVKRSRLCNKISDVVCSSFNDNNSTENQSELSKNNDSKEKDNLNSTEQNVSDEILSKQDGAVQKDSESNSNKVVYNLEKDANNADEVMEDIMDVDFSADF